MELWTAFMLGFAGSAHCAGMCGPLMIALPSGEGGGWRHLLGRLLYNLGRVTTYGLLGIVFGLIGRTLALSGLQRWVSIALGATILVGLALSWQHRFTVPSLGPIRWVKRGIAGLLKRRSLGSLFLLGSLNGLLPCGLVYVACAAAAATGGVLAGIEFMLVFGLGTVPMMLGLGLAGGFLNTALRTRLQQLVPVSLGLVAVLLVLRGMSLGIPYVSPDLSGGSGAACCAPAAAPVSDVGENTDRGGP